MRIKSLESEAVGFQKTNLEGAKKRELVFPTKGHSAANMALDHEVVRLLRKLLDASPGSGFCTSSRG